MYYCIFLVQLDPIIFLAILNFIKQRKLDTFFELEEKIMSKATLDKSLIEIITDHEAGTAEDKMRLFIIYYICTPQISDSDLKRYEAALEEAGCDLSPLAYLKRWKSYAKMIAAPNQYEGIVLCTIYLKNSPVFNSLI